MEAVASTVGKAALAQILGWTRPKLDRRLQSDAAFPVVERGDQSGGWKFDPAKVKSHLGIGPAKAPKRSKASPPPAVDQAQLRDAVALPAPSVAPTVKQSRRSAHHEGEATARQRKDAADAAQKEDNLAKSRKELVVRGEQRQLLAMVFASMGNDLDAVPDEIAKLLNCPDQVPAIRDLIDKIRIRLVRNADPILSEPPADG